jgi:hypothetical protein
MKVTKVVIPEPSVPMRSLLMAKIGAFMSLDDFII